MSTKIVKKEKDFMFPYNFLEDRDESSKFVPELWLINALTYTWSATWAILRKNEEK